MDTWQCIDCKDCEVCGDKGKKLFFCCSFSHLFFVSLTGAEKELVLCDMCDRGFHTFCCEPPLKKLPQGRFLCQDCVFCVSCGSRKAGEDIKAKWHRDYTLCSTCSSQIEKNKYCPICMKAYREQEEIPMIMCDYCDWWIHLGCDEAMNDERYALFSQDPSSKYKCPRCESEGRADPTNRAVRDQSFPESASNKNDRKPFKPVVAAEDPDCPTTKSACRLCHLDVEADDNTLQGPFRIGYNKNDYIWLHEKCVRWSPGEPPYEHPLHSRNFFDLGRLIKYSQNFSCSLPTCGRRGATIGCHNLKCRRVYHYPCAVELWGEFDSHEFYCDIHNREQPRMLGSHSHQQQTRNPIEESAKVDIEGETDDQPTLSRASSSVPTPASARPKRKRSSLYPEEALFEDDMDEEGYSSQEEDRRPKSSGRNNKRARRR